jgi:ABC-type transporter Mla maintaining outer membrane lipid asymmetry permease subunit MlaE
VAFGVAQQRPLEFSNLVLGQITPAMHLSVLLKTALVGYLVGVTACLTGLRAGTEITEVPKLLPVGFVRCAMVVFVVTAVVSAIV